MSRSGRCAIGVMAKAPVAGRAKTRLVPPLTPAQAAQLSAAFLRDTTENIRLAGQSAPIDGYVAYAPAEAASLFDGHIAAGTGFLLADGSPEMPPRVQGFGRCLLHAMQAMLGAGYSAACVLNSDGPTLPTQVLERAAHALLRGGDCVVFGAADDGGYYLLGARAPHPHLFEDIAWSTDSVAAATRARASALGVPVVEMPVWYDVDDAASLQRLIAGDESADVDAGMVPYPAPATDACLRRFGLRTPPLPVAAQ